MSNNSIFKFYTWGRSLLGVDIRRTEGTTVTEEETRTSWASMASFMPVESVEYIAYQLRWLCKRDNGWHDTHLQEAINHCWPEDKVLAVPTAPGWMELTEEQKLYRLWAVDHLTSMFWMNKERKLVIQYLEEVEYLEGFIYWWEMFRYEGDARVKIDKRAVENDFLLCCGYDDSINLEVFRPAFQERIHKLLAEAPPEVEPTILPPI